MSSMCADMPLAAGIIMGATTHIGRIIRGRAIGFSESEELSTISDIVEKVTVEWDTDSKHKHNSL